MSRRTQLLLLLACSLATADNSTSHHGVVETTNGATHKGPNVTSSVAASSAPPSTAPHASFAPYSEQWPTIPHGVEGHWIANTSPALCMLPHALSTMGPNKGGCAAFATRSNGSSSQVLEVRVMGSVVPPKSLGQYGCYEGARDVFWVSHCRGTFLCANGAKVTCPSKHAKDQSKGDCACAPPPPPPPPLPARPPHPSHPPKDHAAKDHTTPLASSKDGGVGGVWSALTGLFSPAKAAAPRPLPVPPSAPAGSCWLFFPSGCPSGNQSLALSEQWVHDAWGESHDYKDGHAGCVRRQQHLRTWCGVDDVVTHHVPLPEASASTLLTGQVHAHAHVHGGEAAAGAKEVAQCLGFCASLPVEKRAHLCKCKACRVGGMNETSSTGSGPGKKRSTRFLLAAAPLREGEACHDGASNSNTSTGSGLAHAQLR